MLRTPVLGKDREVKHHYKAFRIVLSMMVEFNLARQVLGVKHNNNNNNVAIDCHKPVNICLRCVIMKHSGGRY